jgi:cell division protein FtsB
MGRPIDLVVGAIHDMNDDRMSAWSAYFATDTEREKLEDEVKKLKEQIRRLKGGRKIKG